MRRRDTSKKRTKETEAEEDRQEHEEETVKYVEMEQQAGDKEEARGGLDLQIMEKMLKRMSENLSLIHI